MKRQYSLILAVSFMICYNLASGVNFDDCGSINGKPTSVVVSGCNTTSNDCVLKGDSPTSIIIGFTVSEVVTHVKVTAYGLYQNTFYPFYLRSTNGCVDSGLKCPLAKGTNQEYNGVLTSFSALIKGRIIVSSRLYDQNKKVIVCVRFPAIIR